MDDDFSNRTHWLAGELSRAAGVSRDTLRHYERKGVIKRPIRASNGYRLYPEDALERVLLVRRALSVGFTLDELAGILAERDKGGAPCQKARQLAAEKLLKVEDQLAALAALRDELRLTLVDWDERLSEAEPNTKAYLLEILRPSPANKNQPPMQRLRKGKSVSKFEIKRKMKNEKK